MRYFSSLFILFFLALSITEAKAQDGEKTWAIGVGTNGVDILNKEYTSLSDQFLDYTRLDKDLNIYPVISRLYVAKYLGKGFSLDLAAAENKISKIPNNLKAEKKKYYSLDLGARYDLNTLFGQTGWFDPYAKFSLGGVIVQDDWYFTSAPALGFNIWFNSSVGINIESSFKGDGSRFLGTMSHFLIPENLRSVQYLGAFHFHHAFSFVVKFGSKKQKVKNQEDCSIHENLQTFSCHDLDGDGIRDKVDACPELPGGLATDGCPDQDEDGIADKNDSCPKLPGDILHNGCPDDDGDGIANHKDSCPEVPGQAKFFGCPDTDLDGLVDKNDNCPNEFGPKENSGCPWPDTDQDGVADHMDHCVHEKGRKDNHGCPLENVERPRKTLGAYAKSIHFSTGDYKLKQSSKRILNNIVQVMKEYEDVRFDIQGHTDATGNKDLNLKLSQKRVEAVSAYLISQGIEACRLHIEGYGKIIPVASNKTALGRVLNRRVVLTAVE